jgi:hypothetical protein
MHKGILRLGFLTAITAGFFAAFPYVSNTNVTYAGQQNCTGSKCGPFTQKWQKKWNGFKCPDFRVIDATNKSSVNGYVDSRYRKSSPFPGCADKVRVKTKCGVCYQITLKGRYDYNCDARVKKEHQYTDVLFQMPNAYNKNKLQKFNYFSFNGGSIRSVLPDVNKLDEKYSKPTSNNEYSFYWMSQSDNAQIEMFIKEYPNGNYIDNKGKINFTIEEVEADKCKYCPVPQPETQ